MWLQNNLMLCRNQTKCSFKTWPWISSSPTFKNQKWLQHYRAVVLDLQYNTCWGVNFIAQLTYSVSPLINDRSRASDTAANSCFSSHDCKTRLDLSDLSVIQICRWRTQRAICVRVIHFESHIKRTVFTRQFPWLWDRAFLWAVKLSGSHAVEKLKCGSTSKWNSGMCGTLRQQGSVGLRICYDLRGFLTVQQHTCTLE